MKKLNPNWQPLGQTSPPPSTKTKMGIGGVLMIAAAFFFFLPHGILGKRKR